MNFEIIPESEAPAAPTTISDRLSDAMEIVQGLSNGQVAKFEAESTVRAEKVMLARAGKTLNVAINTWAIDNTIYVKLN